MVEGEEEETITLAPFNNLKSIKKDISDALLEFNFDRHWVWWKMESGSGLQSWAVWSLEHWGCLVLLRAGM